MRIQLNYICIIFWALCSMQAHAHAMPGDAVITGLAIYLIPSLAGLIIAGKGNRLWFCKVAIIIYLISWLAAMLATGQTKLMIFLFLPSVLLPVGIYKRYKKSAI